MSILEIRNALELALNGMLGIIPSVGITSSASSSAVEFTTSSPHLLKTNVEVTIAGHSGSIPDLNKSYLVTVTSPTKFTLRDRVTKSAIASTAGGTGGVVSANLTAWEGVAFATVPGVPYQRVNLLPAMPENPSFGGNFSREVGFMQLTLYYPVQDGTEALMTRAELLRSTFKRGSSFTDGGIVVHVQKTPQIYPTTINEESICSVVRIPYWADVFS